MRPLVLEARCRSRATYMQPLRENPGIPAGMKTITSENMHGRTHRSAPTNGSTPCAEVPRIGRGWSPSLRGGFRRNPGGWASPGFVGTGPPLLSTRSPRVSCPAHPAWQRRTTGGGCPYGSRTSPHNAPPPVPMRVAVTPDPIRGPEPMREHFSWPPDENTVESNGKTKRRWIPDENPSGMTNKSKTENRFARAGANLK